MKNIPVSENKKLNVDASNSQTASSQTALNDEPVPAAVGVTLKKAKGLVEESAVDVGAKLDSHATSIADSNDSKAQEVKSRPVEINGPKGLEPTRYGDWESKGRCYDF